MIADRMDRLENYGKTIEDIKPIAAYLKTVDLMALPVGRYPIPGTEAYFMIQEYTTRMPEEGGWESHQRFIDIQCILSGEEYMGWAPVEDMEADGEYDTAKDLQIYKRKEGTTAVIVREGQFGLFLPADAHMPGCAVQAPTHNRKMVIKVPVSRG